MRFRKLRIACAVGAGIACALLIATAYIAQPTGPPPPPGSRPYGSSWDLRFTRSGTLVTETFHDWSGDWMGKYAERRKLPTIDYLGFNRQALGGQYLLAIPHWFPIVLSMILGYWTPAVLSLARRLAARASLRFSLRTLLIFTTFVAIVLGLIVWAAH